MATGQFELHQLRCFVAVATELNFSRAAARMNMTQPPLSRQIKLLEHAMGMTLLERSNRNVRLTPAGENFLSSAVDLLQRAEHAVLKAQQAARGEAGSVRMGFVPSAALEFVPRVVQALSDRLPEVRFQPSEMMSYEIVEALSSGRLDFGLTRTPGRGGSISAVRVVREPLVLAVPANHPLAEKSQVSVSDLDEVAFIGFSSERGGVLQNVHQGLFSSARVAPRIVQEVSQTQTMLALVNQGLGVALVPRSAQAQQMVNLRYRALDIPAQFSSEIYLCFAAGDLSPLHEFARKTIIDTLAGEV